LIVLCEHCVRISGYAAAPPARRISLNHLNDTLFRVIELGGIPPHENRRPGRFADGSAAFRVSRLKFENTVFVHFYLLMVCSDIEPSRERPVEQTILFIFTSTNTLTRKNDFSFSASELQDFIRELEFMIGYAIL